MQGFLIKVVAFFLVIIVFIALIQYVATETGLAKSTYEVTLEIDEVGGAGINYENVNFLMTSQKEPYKVSSIPFEADGTVETKVKKGSYWMSLETDGLVSILDGSSTTADGLDNHTVEMSSDSDLYLYILLLEVEDIDGNKFGAQDITVSTGDGSLDNIGELEDGTLVVVLRDDGFINGIELTIQADGYEEFVVKADELSRASRVSVTLTPEKDG